MEYMTPNFTKDMVKTHKILIPNMAVTQFRLMQAALASEGYQTEVLGNCGSEVAQLGLKYVHNDTCYPALLVIGQFLDALNSGKYDLEHTALLITQTGGGAGRGTVFGPRQADGPRVRTLALADDAKPFAHFGGQKFKSGPPQPVHCTQDHPGAGDGLLFHAGRAEGQPGV